MPRFSVQGPEARHIRFISFPAMVNRPDWFFDDARFRAAAQALGYTAYWETHEAPDFCDKDVQNWVCEV